MSLSKKNWTRRAVLIGVFALAGCGFTPVYGPGGTGDALRGQVQVNAPETPSGYHFAAQVDHHLGPATQASYVLDVTLNTNRSSAGVTSNQETTRFTLNGRANYRLSNPATGAQITAGQVSSFTSYSATASPAATLSAEQDAERRLAIALADLVVDQLLITTP